MKFIIRDDDVNFFYQPKQLERWYEGIFEICPISICAVPYIKGDYFKWVYMAEKDKDNFMKHKEEFYDDDEVHPIHENEDLIKTLKRWEKEGKVSVSMHGIYHRSWDKNVPDISNNYSTGAEFLTEKDMTQPLQDAKAYLEKTFGHTINAFAAPQNIISYSSYRSLRNARLNVCCNIPTPKRIVDFISIFGLYNFFKLSFGRLINPHYLSDYFVMMQNDGFKFINDVGGLYPGGLSIEDVLIAVEKARKQKGDFVLCTHSYGFDFYLPQCKMTVKEAIIKILEYVRNLDDVEFSSLEKLFVGQ